ncbi:MAG: aminotransferase class I/II-fold pyridoxal phosphate-dependent enzyme [Thermoplasmatota archaeon]
MTRIPVAKRFDGVTSAIRDMLGPARELERKGHKVLKLNIGDPAAFDLRPPAELIEAFRAVADDTRYGDSEGEVETRDAIARYENARGVRLGRDDIVFTYGVSEGLAMVCAALLDPGDEIIVPSPAYPPYITIPLVYHGKPVQYRCDPAKGFSPDLADVERKITPRTKAICLISPNNPTGGIASRESVERLAALAASRGIPLVSDEIYSELAFDGTPPSGAALAKGPVILMNGMSKSWVVPGWRSGYLGFRAPNGELDDAKEAVLKQARLRLSATMPVQRAFAKVLRHDAPHFKELRAKLGERAKLVTKRVAETDALSLVEPKGAFYAFPKIEKLGKRTDKQWALDLLQEEKVLVVNGSGFGDAGVGHFRIVILPPPDVLDDAMTRIIRFAEKTA